jgi:hypothetical protein
MEYDRVWRSPWSAGKDFRQFAVCHKELTVTCDFLQSKSSIFSTGAVAEQCFHHVNAESLTPQFPHFQLRSLGRGHHHYGRILWQLECLSLRKILSFRTDDVGQRGGSPRNRCYPDKSRIRTCFMQCICQMILSIRVYGRCPVT